MTFEQWVETLDEREKRLMPDETGPMDNVARLLKHLEGDSLAARLVHAHHTPQKNNDRVASMKAVLTERLERVRAKLDGATD